MNFSLILLLILNSLCLASVIMAQEVSLSKNGCPQKCGDITIPYPFGIGPNCSFNSSYTVTCSNESNPPKPFLVSTGLEAIEFFFNDNTVRVKHNVFPLNCSSTNGELQIMQSLVDTPFSLGAAINRLVVVGCTTEVSLAISAHSGGCRPACGGDDSAAGCYGVNCCSAIVPALSQGLRANYTTFAGGGGVGGDDSVCGYVFLADFKWLTSDYKKYVSLKLLKSVPVLLEWRFDEEDVAAVRSMEGAVCENRSVETHTFDDNVYAFNISRCRCGPGFEGNPYLLEGGCVDIDECRNSSLNSCGVGSDCVNKAGSFMCRNRSGNDEVKSMVIGVSSAMGALLLLGLGWMLSKLIKNRVRANRRRRFFKRNGGLLLERRLCSGDGGFEKIKLFEARELARATDGYDEDRVLGRGGQGTVYKGMLRDGRIVAVKKLKRMDEGDVEGFVNEVVIMSHINHRNVVKLLGCCLETEVPLLVYEFVPNGTLFQRIHDRNNEFTLSWEMRLGIAAEIAGALSYLHNSATSPIYHRDIKSTNILLDDKYRAKVSDFGISRSIGIDQTHLTTRVLGTFGYLDPQYFFSSKFTEKSDVYSFGVVMVEILTGEKAVSEAGAELGSNLAADFLHSMGGNHLFDILDPEVVKGGGVDEIMSMANLARRCLQPRGERRPTMKEVAVELEGIRMMEEGSVLPSYHQEKDFQSIDFSEDCDFSSISDTTNLSFNTAKSSEFPLLFGS